MARTDRDTRKLSVSLYSIIETLTTEREDADYEGICKKVKQLLRKNKLPTTGKYNTRIKRLINYYGKNPHKLPTVTEMRLYKNEIVFTLDEHDNIVEEL